MKVHSFPFIVALWVLVVFVSKSSSLEPVSGTLAVVGAVGLSIFSGGFDFVKCKFYECCTTNWVKPDAKGLKVALQNQVFGQHVVVQATVHSITSHMRDEKPSKALVLSFHGWAGGGKNHVARIIAEELFTNGMKSKYVHFFKGDVHFKDPSRVMEYKENLQQWIKGNVTDCEQRNLFIFDEFAMTPPEVLDAIRPFIDFGAIENQHDFSKSIFLFLSNTGGDEITKRTLRHWESGRSREEITKSDLESAIAISAFNEQGGLHKSRLISSGLVDVFIPFLPMERSHVRLCIMDEIRRRNYTSVYPEGAANTHRFMDRVLDDIEFFPKENPLFSKTGCKRVAQKVGYNIALDHDEF